MSKTPQSAKPSLGSRVKPFEIVVLAAIFSVFAGGVVLLGTRSWLTALIAFGIAFIVVLVVFATLALTVSPDDAETEEILRERQEQNERTIRGENH